MKIIRGFTLADRYTYDFGLCSYENGFAQVDTSQDASYFGTWANPWELAIANYCEGDTTLHLAANASEFIQEIRDIAQWNEENGHKFRGIDPGWPWTDLAFRFTVLGLGDLLH